MATREFLEIVQEAVFNTAATITLGTNAIVLRLDQDNSFTMRPAPIRVIIGYGGGYAVAGNHVSAKEELTGNLSVLLCASQSKFLLGWAANPIDATQTIPWTTTEPIGDLASCSIYHGILRSDGTYRRRLYTGVKVATMKLASTSDQQTWRLDLTLRGSTVQTDPTSTVFPVPVDANYASDFYLFTHLAGGLDIGTSRTSFLESSFNRTNKVDAQWFETKFAQLVRCYGHDTTLDAKLLLKGTPDDRAAFEALTQQTITFTLSNGTHTDNFNFQNANILTTVEDDLPNDRIYQQRVTGSFVHDYVAGDMTYTHT